MEENYFEILEDFLTEIRLLHIANLGRVNAKYAEICDIHVEESSRFEEFVDNLPKEDRDFFEKYKCDYYDICDIQQKWLYMQGYLDCIKLQKYLDVLQ